MIMELVSDHSDGIRSLVKLLLEHLGNKLGTTGLSIYRKCLSSSLDLRTSLHAISIMDEENVRLFYRLDSIDKDPQFLSLEHPMTLRTIADACDIRLVIKATIKSNPSVILFDSGDDEWMQEPSSRRKNVPTMTYTLMTSNKQGGGQEVKLSFNSQPHDQDQSRYFMIDGIEKSNGGCELRALMKAAGNEASDPTDGHWEHREVVLDPSAVKALTKKRIVAVACKNKKLSAWKKHLQTEKRLTKAQLFNPKSYEMTLLFEINKESEDQEALVLMPREHGGWYKLNEKWSKEVLFRFKKKQPKVKKPTRDPVVPEELQLVTSMAQPGEEEADAENQQPNKKDGSEDKEQSKEKKNKEQSKEPEPKEKPCCDCCVGSKCYEQNMASKGPQLLYKKPIDTVLLAKICGFYTNSMEDNLNRCHRMSMASMDIESTTEPLRPFGETEQKESNKAPHITEEPVRDDNLNRCKVQKPLCIGHSGGNPDIPAEGDLSTVKVFFRNRGSVQSMVSAYSAYLVEERERMEKEKRLLLAPMLDRLSAYKKVFFEHWSSNEDSAFEKKGLVMSWERHFLGQLETNLLQLCKKMVIFSFNGSR